MRKISEAALKKGILAVEAERLKNPPAFRPNRLQRAALEKGHRESEEMVSAFLREAGLDLRKFQALQEQRSAELERMVAQHKADAVRRAANQKHTLQSSITAQAEGLRDLASRNDLLSPYPSVALGTPFLMSSQPAHSSDTPGHSVRPSQVAKRRACRSRPA